MKKAKFVDLKNHPELMTIQQGMPYLNAIESRRSIQLAASTIIHLAACWTMIGYLTISKNDKDPEPNHWTAGSLYTAVTIVNFGLLEVLQRRRDAESQAIFNAIEKGSFSR